MISIVLYGRNDSYGYNLHKRAALSFNCMAELLTDENDEILFVDYNTPDDFPTFPEAIQDTLTPLARKRLRILRVRPPVHKRFQERTRLVALEPVSRNVAVRRSNPANRWILSTNTDMVFVPRGERSSLSDIVRDLPPGFYHAPRLEIPETLWEGLDRQKPQLAIETIKDWGRSLHLNEIVLGASTILYDGPGDFQLIERADLFKYHGFDEEMILGWHVDSNIAKRLSLVYGKVGDLGAAMFGYHCDHTRQITPAHSHTRTENDWRRFVEDLTDPYVASQADTWGCAADAIEEIRLSDDNSATYAAALRDAIGAPLESVPVVTYAAESYGKIDYDPRHVLPFLADLFVSAPRNSVLAWAGVRWETLELFARVWGSLGFSEPIMVDEALAAGSNFPLNPGVSRVAKELLSERADMFVIDFGSAKRGAAPNRFGGLTSDQRRAIAGTFLDIVGAERSRWTARRPLRRIACLNAIHTPYETLVRGHIGAGLTPFATRMRHGFTFPPMVGKEDWTRELQVGAAATRNGEALCAKPDTSGVICYGPYRALFPGRYRFEFAISGAPAAGVDPNAPVGVIELMWGMFGVALAMIRASDLEAGRIVIELDVDDSLDPSCVLQTIVRTFVPSTLAITSLFCEEIAFTEPRIAQTSKVLDWLGVLMLGPSGEWNAAGQIVVKAGVPGFAAYGPYWTLSPGRYELCIDFESDVDEHQPFLVVEAISEGECRALASVRGALQRPHQCQLEFEVHEDESPTGELPVEVRLRSTGPGGLVKAVKVHRIGAPTQPSPWIKVPDDDTDWLDFMARPRSARTEDTGERPPVEGMAFGPKDSGVIAYGPGWTLPPGRYEVAVALTAALFDDDRVLMAEVWSGDRCRAFNVISAPLPETGKYLFPFEVHASETPAGPAPIELRLRATGATGVVSAINIRRSGDVVNSSPWVDYPGRNWNWLEFLTMPATSDAEVIYGLVPREGVALRPNQTGVIAYGPDWILPEGHYEVSIAVDTDRANGDKILALEIWSGRRCRAFNLIAGKEAETGQCRFPFEVHSDESPTGPLPIELRLRAIGAACLVRAIHVRRTGDVAREHPWIEFPRSDLDWLEFLSVPDKSRWSTAQKGAGDRWLSIRSGELGVAAFGPYWSLDAGRYEACIRLEARAPSGPFLRIEIFSDGDYRAVAYIDGASAQAGECRLHFEVSPNESPTGTLPVEMRLFAAGGAGVVKGIAVRRVGDATRESPWIPFPEPPANWDEAARRGLGSVLKAVGRRLGGET